ncbi:hypothetical protein BD560DRAFT_400598 [Blakeslea trispora]|nr:hypothetical protein BD560DRAFT_400598 [Blakeslea trispora]
MRRRYTIDSPYGTKLFCQCHSTGNNNHSGPVLSHRRFRSTFSVCDHQYNAYIQSRKYDTFPSSVCRRCCNVLRQRSLLRSRSKSSIRASLHPTHSFQTTKSSLQHKQKRRTLANILSALAQTSTTTPSDHPPFHLLDTNESDLSSIGSQDFRIDMPTFCPSGQGSLVQNNEKKSTHLHDNSPLDSTTTNQSIGNQHTRRDQTHSVHYQTQHQTCYMPAGQDEYISNTVIQMPQPLSRQFEKKSFDFVSIDMYLFLFGFLFFPFWWYGAWRYFAFNSNQRHDRFTRQYAFQVFNICFSLVSLLLIGLIIGLITVWTQQCYFGE